MGKEIKNKNLAHKAKQERMRVMADNLLRAAKVKEKPSHRLEEARKIVSGVVYGGKAQKLSYDHGFERLLKLAEEETDLLEGRDRKDFVMGLYRMASWQTFWVRQPEDWAAKSHNTHRQFSSLARHLFAKYDVPLFMDSAWLKDGNRDQREQEWFIHIGGGGNIRKAGKLPIPLTKMMAHHFLQAPDNYSITEAIRYGQVCGMGGSERLAEAVCGSPLREFGTELVRRANAPTLAACEPVTDWVNEKEEFWQNVINFLIRNDNMLDLNQVAPIIDYINNQKYVPVGRVNVGGTFVTLPPPQPGFSMAGRTIDTLLAQVEAWHTRLAKIKSSGNISWFTCGIEGLDRIEGEVGNQKRYTVTELLTSADLKDEGAKMRHCVYSYAHSCSIGRTAIYSLKADTGHGLERRLTVEVSPKLRMITQARGKFNVASTPLDQRILQIWATQEKLTYSRGALARWA